MNDSEAAGAAVGVIFFSCFAIVYLAVIVLIFAGQWKAFAKAGRPGWAAIVPIYNLIVLADIAGKPGWFVVLYFVPFANIVAIILTSLAIARAFGKSEGFGIGLAFLGPIFWPILGFGSAQYVGLAQSSPPGGWTGGGGFGPSPGAGQQGGWGPPPAPPGGQLGP